jgi:hypothetical protein
MRKNHRHRKDKRRLEAEERQTAYNALSDDEKLDRCDRRPGACKRERRRILGN